ncbi:hypothetical protein LCGC14_0379760 [marine sediment metagenome]|uniref:Heme oxygenase n=1 Tax=marine sediment metagenome TaxID=412755 RepID=A0A0F9TKX1_9ZZZZ|nr:biliverdin-producing heme oxygenase [Halomonas sp.]HDZ45383.1 hypothetical protein [Halomonas sp.]HEB04865.1 hypothetical protein [Halomonas sp.]
MSKLTLSEWLKRETRADHHRVDQHPLLKPLLKRDVSLEEYATALSALYAPIASLEMALNSSLPANNVDYVLVERAALLKADIEQLGGQAEPAYRIPPSANVAEVVGKLYVLEGSRLGGAMIARHIHSVLGSQAPLRFFTAQPLQAEQWAAFWRCAEHYCPPPSWPALRVSAQQAFEYFIQGVEAEVGSI